MHLDEPGRGQTLAHYFEVTDWRGEIACADPDGFVLDARFLAPPEAIRAAEAIPWLRTPGPTVSYLRGEAARGTLWFYRATPDGPAALVAHAP